MPIELKAHLVPSMAREEHLAGSTAVVIDLLRASTTICAALWNGAKSVAVQLEPQAARIFAGARPAGTCVLGGERRASVSRASTSATRLPSTQGAASA